MTDNTAEIKVRNEFNQWAAAGRGEEMEDHHLPITEPVLQLMDLKPDDRLLDVGCGSGWLCRRIARLVPEGQVVGIDISPEMVRRALATIGGYANLNFMEGTADRVPCESESFSKIISVESAYYWPDPAACLRDMFRVLAKGGNAWILINYYLENQYAHQWGPIVNIPTHLLSADQWMALYCDAGFVDVQFRQIPDPTPVADTYTGRWFRDAEQMRKFHQVGALLVYGTKPKTPIAGRS
ncbi:MAG: class I SAM-dependent methyltransferase [Acidobacteria bacterium]|nr:MAG: class I SAM-dependent methyltransferase [Acidobacteriota bacterium]